MDANSLDTLIELARGARDEALARFAQLERQAEQARSHLGVLRGYAQDYERRAQPRAGDGLDPAAQANQRAFRQRLQQAVEAQQADVATREQRSVAARTEVAHFDRKLKSLETLRSRRAEQQRLALALRDQKQTDEHAQRAHRHAGNTGFNHDPAALAPNNP